MENEKRIFDQLLEGCLIIDENFRYTYINEAAAKQAQKTREELLGKTVMEAYPGVENTEMFLQLKRCLQENAQYEMVSEFRFIDNSSRWFQLRMTRIPEGVFILSLEITDTKKAHMDEVEKGQKYKKILENLKDIVHIISVEGAIMYVTPSVESILGYKPEEFIGTDARSYLHPDDIEWATQKLQGLLESPGNSTGIFEQRIRHKDGKYLTMEVVAVNMLADSQIGGIVVTSRDVSVKNRSEERFKKLIENSKDMIHIVDRSGKILYVTPSVRNVVGFTPEEFMQKDGNSYIHPDDRKKAMASLEQIFAAPHKALGPFQFRVLHKDGSYRLVEVTGVNLFDEPLIGGIVVTSRDVSAWKNEQSELSQRYDELEKLNHLMVGRELKMLELKEQNRKLEAKLGQLASSPNAIDKSS